MKKTAIITGSSSGFGLLCALELAKQNFNVVATMRDKSKACELLKIAEEQQTTENIEVRHLDVTSMNLFSPLVRCFLLFLPLMF